MSETNPEDGDLAHEIAHRAVSIVQGFRITGPVGQEHAARLVAHHFVRGRGRGDDLHAKAALTKSSEDVVLDTEIKGNDRYLGVRKIARVVHSAVSVALNSPRLAQLIFWVPCKRLPVSDLFHVVHADDALPVPRSLESLCIAQVLSRDARLHRALDAELFRQGTGIDS